MWYISAAILFQRHVMWLLFLVTPIWPEWAKPWLPPMLVPSNYVRADRRREKSMARKTSNLEIADPAISFRSAVPEHFSDTVQWPSHTVNTPWKKPLQTTYEWGMKENTGTVFLTSEVRMILWNEQWLNLAPIFSLTLSVYLVNSNATLSKMTKAPLFLCFASYMSSLHGKENEDIEECHLTLKGSGGLPQ